MLESEQLKCLHDNDLHYVCGYLYRQLKKWHECVVCDNICLAGKGWLKKNEIFTNLKKYNDPCSIVNVSQAFHFYVDQCEKKLLSVFDSNCFKQDIGLLLLDELKSANLPFKCIGFPTYKFLIFFVRLRLDYLLKFNNQQHVSKLQGTIKMLKQVTHV
jgi:hypothetical protein